MPNIIQTKHGVYDVDTIFGCYSYLIRECGLSGDRCAMVNKLYVMANIAELGAEQKRPDGVVEALKLAYRKHWLNDDSIGWDELGDKLCDALCNAMGDREFSLWLQQMRAAVGGEHE